MRCVILLLSFLLVFSVEAKTRHLKWEVEYKFWSPDGEEHVVMAINGQFPGPTIRANVGDVISVDLTNKLSTEGVVIHWHGIRQIGTPWADGTASISQCAINPGESFTYRFTVDRAGTYFYHGHYGMQRSAGLYGSLIVEGVNEPFQYDGELNLLLSDWWHESTHHQELGLSSVPFRWIHEPESILLNGRGQYNCSLAAGLGNTTAAPCKLKGTEQWAPPILRVLPNKTYRLRLASTTALASLNLAIANHKLTVVEADGNYVEPFVVDDIDIYSGESYSVLFTTDQNPTNNYWVSVGVRGRKPETPPALTLLNYNPTTASKLPTTPPPATPRWDDYSRSLGFASKILSRPGSPIPPPKPDRRILLLNTQNKLNGGVLRWSINNVSLTLPSTPYLGSMKFKLNRGFDQTPPPETFPAEYDITVPPTNPNTTIGNGVYKLGFNTTVDVILQNANALSVNTSEIHPWHLHGHDFWVLGYGAGKFTEGVDERKFNLKNPPYRNTAIVFPYGWTALRFVADNPGVWAFHCHIEPHLHMGMGVVFAEGVEKVKSIPKSALGCGMTAPLLGRKG